MKKPSLFIASSVESIEIAKSVQENLEYSVFTTIWSQAFFELSKTSLDSLIEKLDEFDFSIFIFSPDDVSIIREVEHSVIRDNVIFELGLFIGRLGKERCFIIHPRNVDIHIPTDLLAITPATYDKDHPNLTAALGSACTQVEKIIKKLGFFHTKDKIQNLMGGEGKHDSILSLNGEAFIRKNKAKIRFSPDKWSILDIKNNPASEYEFLHYSKQGHAMLIFEELNLEIEVVVKYAIKLIHSAGSVPDILYQNNVSIKNGNAIEVGLTVELEGIVFFYHNLYLSTKKGIIQIMTWCPIELRDTLQTDLKEFVYGILIPDS